MTSERRNGNGRRGEDDMNRQLGVIAETVKHIDRRLDGFVTKHEFEPVKKIAYGLVSLLMGALVVYMVASAFG